MSKADTTQSTTAPATATAPAADTPMMTIFSVWAFSLHYIESSPGPDEETNRRVATHSAIERLLLATPAASGEDLAALAWVTLDIAGAFDHKARHPFPAAAAGLYPRLAEAMRATEKDIHTIPPTEREAVLPTCKT